MTDEDFKKSLDSLQIQQEMLRGQKKKTNKAQKKHKKTQWFEKKEIILYMFLNNFTFIIIYPNFI